MNLKHLTDLQLIKDSDLAVDRERESTTKVLHHFREIDRRRLFSDLKYGSLFEMAMKRYKYTEDQANFRIAAMRLLKELPEIENKIADGSLSLTHLNMVRSHFRKEKKLTSKEVPRIEKLELLKKLEKTSMRESKQVLIAASSAPIQLPKDELRVISENKISIKFVADKIIEGQISQLKGLLAHAHPDLTLGELFKKLCELGLKEWSKARDPKKKFA